MERCLPASCSYWSQPPALSRGCRRHPHAVRCSSSRRFNPPGRDSLSGEGQLVMPGHNERGQQDRPSKLIMPGDSSSGSSTRQPGRGNLLGLDPPSAPPPTVNAFRPPPGFMDSEKPRDTSALIPEIADPQVALNRIRAGAGHWHELAQLLPGLAVAGYDATIVDAETGVERRTQSRWTVSLQVYESLAKAEEFPAEKLAYFDVEGGEDLLHEMRFLPVAARPAAAEFIVDTGLDATEATVLSRAIKEHERRAGHKEGFSAQPGDCLAYKHYRDAQECRKEAAREACVARGLAVAATEPARRKLRALVEAEPEEDRVASAAKLAIYKLTPEEVAFKPVPLLPGLAELCEADLAEVPAARQRGPFNAFSLAQEGKPGQQWVGLPAWNLLLLARRPYAVPLRNCADIPAVLAAAEARTEEDKRRAGGPGLLIVDRTVKAVSEEHFYLVPAASGQGLEMVEGGQVAAGADATLGQVIFCCRLPVLGARGPAAETSELLQL